MDQNDFFHIYNQTKTKNSLFLSCIKASLNLQVTISIKISWHVKLSPVLTEAKLQLQYYMSKIQTFIKKNYSDNLILVYQFLSLKWTKISKTNVNHGTASKLL